MKLALALFVSVLLPVAGNAASKADLKAKTVDGEKVQLKDLRGKLVILNFWATWCGPCREELPMLVKAASASSAPDLIFIAVSVDEPKTQGKVPEMARDFGIKFPVWTGANGDDLYRLSKGEAVPATVFVDRDGSILSRVSGQIRESELNERLAWLTGDRQGPKPKEFVSHVK